MPIDLTDDLVIGPRETLRFTEQAYRFVGSGVSPTSTTGFATLTNYGSISIHTSMFGVLGFFALDYGDRYVFGALINQDTGVVSIRSADTFSPTSGLQGGVTFQNNGYFEVFGQRPDHYWYTELGHIRE